MEKRFIYSIYVRFSSCINARGGMPCRSSFFGAKITGRFSAEGVRSRSLGCVVLLAFLRFGTPTQSRGSWSWQWRYGAVPGSDASTRCCILRPILFIGVKESSIKTRAKPAENAAQVSSIAHRERLHCGLHNQPFWQSNSVQFAYLGHLPSFTILR